MSDRRTGPPPVELIDLDLPRTGYRRFIGCWLYRDADLCYVVDPGPPATVPHLAAELSRRGVGRLDAILLTHVHLDHGGGAGHLAALYPDATVLCLERAMAHLADPTRLWEGSLAVLGETARLFGRPRPVPARRLAPPDALAERGIGWLPTPGHASHHVCYRHGDLLFAGEALGVRFPLPAGKRYLRPATPPPFRPAVYRESLARLAGLAPPPRWLAFGHGGLCRAEGMAGAADRQIRLWLEIVAEETTRRGDRQWSPDLQRRVEERLLARDPDFASFPLLPGDVRVREREYLRNTLCGLLGALAEGLPAGDQA